MGKSKGKKSKGKTESREMVVKEDGQVYAVVTKMLGNGRVSMKCYDGKDRLGIIRGAMRKRVWINVDDIVLVALREFEDAKADIVHKYNSDETRKLKNMGELPALDGHANQVDEEESDVFDFSEI